MVRTAQLAGFDHVIGFDMGGTSTDVSHFAGEFERAFETQVAGVRMRAPMMSIHTVAAGGGSILRLRRRAPARRPAQRGREPGPGELSPRRPAGRHRLQRAARQDPADVVPARCSARRPTSRSTATPSSPRFDAHGRRRSRARTGQRAHARGDRRGLPRHRRRQHGQRDQEDLGGSAATTSRATRCSASAAPAASTPAWSPTRWA